MKPKNIVQFECFETKMPLEDFVSSWEYYATRVGGDTEVTLHQSDARNRFKYISSHESAADNFHFVFMKGRNSEHFHDRSVKVVQAGGYSMSQPQHAHRDNSNDVKIIIFVKNEKEFALHSEAPPHQSVNIYRPYFQSCLFAGVLEFYVEKKQVNEFAIWVKQSFTESEGGVYRECLVLNALE